MFDSINTGAMLSGRKRGLALQRFCWSFLDDCRLIIATVYSLSEGLGGMIRGKTDGQ